MNPESASGLTSRRFEFFFPERDALVLVELCQGEVVVRSTRGNFSRARKEAFVCELVAEGFIPESYRWALLAEPGSFRGVRWVVDASWVRLPAGLLQRTRRFMLRLLVSTAVLWAAMVGGAVLHAVR